MTNKTTFERIAVLKSIPTEVMDKFEDILEEGIAEFLALKFIAREYGIGMAYKLITALHDADEGTKIERDLNNGIMRLPL